MPDPVTVCSLILIIILSDDTLRQMLVFHLFSLFDLSIEHMWIHSIFVIFNSTKLSVVEF